MQTIKVKRRQGLTLIEMMLSCVMLAVFTPAFTFAFFIVLKNWNFQRQRLDLRESAIWALENFSRDLHQARSVSLAQANRITFTTSFYEAIDYNRLLRAGTWQLMRTRTLSTSPPVTTTASVAKNVSSFLLQYYDSAGRLIPTPVPPIQLANIRLVRVTLSIQSTLLNTVETITLRTQVRPRNL